MRFRSAAVVVVICLSAAGACSSKTPPNVTPTPSAASGRPDTLPLALVPMPRQVERRRGEFHFTQATVIYADETFTASARFLSEFIGLAFGAAPPRVEPLGSEPPEGA